MRRSDSPSSQSKLAAPFDLDTPGGFPLQKAAFLVFRVFPSRVWRAALLGDLKYDVSFTFHVASDFIGSSRDGIRFPSHAVGYVELTDNIEMVFGVDFLDRDDVRILPVGGLLLRPDPDVRIELVFPRPRVELQLTEDYRLYFRGGLGGGSWAVERDSRLNDVASLYELEAAIGLAKRISDGDWSAAEFVYLYDRKLQYTSGVGNYSPTPTVMFRIVTLY